MRTSNKALKKKIAQLPSLLNAIAYVEKSLSSFLIPSQGDFHLYVVAFPMIAVAFIHGHLFGKHSAIISIMVAP